MGRVTLPSPQSPAQRHNTVASTQHPPGPKRSEKRWRKDASVVPRKIGLHRYFVRFPKKRSLSFGDGRLSGAHICKFCRPQLCSHELVRSTWRSLLIREIRLD
ncbi:hypothetical protein Zmor_007013 [Zophobas morio]|uniref:Uncharacterized protein n=1 Tax=Zophobas morio TaxID=2755281 RepID=A0AA38MNY1_9CUCU|nr:hypothetical protein Zmor_007013 [Zophobas morio]